MGPIPKSNARAWRYGNTERPANTTGSDAGCGPRDSLRFQRALARLQTHARSGRMESTRLRPRRSQRGGWPGRQTVEGRWNGYSGVVRSIPGVDLARQHPRPRPTPPVPGRGHRPPTSGHTPAMGRASGRCMCVASCSALGGGGRHVVCFAYVLHCARPRTHAPHRRHPYPGSAPFRPCIYDNVSAPKFWAVGYA